MKSSSIVFDRKGYETFMKVLENKKAEEALRQQMEMFWLLQLQFMELDSFDLSKLFFTFRHKMSNTKYVKKNTRRAYKGNEFDLDFAEKSCLATTIAMFLAGIEE